MSKTKTKKQKEVNIPCLLTKVIIGTALIVSSIFITVNHFRTAALIDSYDRKAIHTEESLRKELERKNPSVETEDVSEEEENEELYSSALEGAEGVVQQFFVAYNREDFETACDVIADTKCDATSAADVTRFSQEFDKLQNGYNRVKIWTPEVVDFEKDVVCVQYDYKYVFDINEKNIQETFSFYVEGEDVTARVCEQKLVDGEVADCPIEAKRNFCVE